MADDYAVKLLKISLAQLCQNVGFQSGTNISLAVLVDIFHRYMQTMCKTLRRHSDHVGRIDPTLEDVEPMFVDLRIPLRELSDYINQVAPIPFKHKVPLFPVARPSKLRIPPLDSEELQTRPDYIPLHLPLMKPEVVPAPSSKHRPDESKLDKSSDSIPERLNAARISAHRSTISMHNKHDLSQYGELIPDFSEFDAIKAGLVKFVRVPTPPPVLAPPLTYTYPAALSPVAPIPTISIPLAAKPPVPPLIKVVEDKAAKKKPTALDFRPHTPKATLSILSHSKLKISLPSMKKKRVLPIIVKRKERKDLKIVDSMDQETKKRKQKSVPFTFSIEDDAANFPNIPEHTPELESKGGFSVENVGSDAVVPVALDTSTASSSVEDLVTSVVEETHNEIKTQHEHFEDSVNSVVFAKTETSTVEGQKTEEPVVLAGAGTLSGLTFSIPVEEPVVSVQEPQVDQIPTTSAATDIASPNSEQLKTILSRSRKVINKDVIKQRLKEKSARKEAEEKKIQEVVERNFPPIAKKDDDIAPTIAAVAPTPTNAAAPTVADTAQKLTRGPPGIPPTTIRLQKDKSEKRPLSIVRPDAMPKLQGKISMKNIEPLPPLFKPEHIKKSVQPASSESRKVAPLVISTKVKGTPGGLQISPSQPPPVAEPKRPEATKLIIKLPHAKPVPKPAVEVEKKHHSHGEKEKKREKHREKSSETQAPFVKKEKKDKPKIGDVVSALGATALETAIKPATIGAPKTLKLKINLGKPKVEAEVVDKEPKAKEKSKAPIFPLAGPTNADYNTAPLSPPPKSPSAHSKSPSHTGSIAGASAGGESPPPRTPSPGNSSPPPSPVYVDVSQKRKTVEPAIEPPVKKQRVEQWPTGTAPTVSVGKPQSSTSIPAAPSSQLNQAQGDAWYCPVCNVPYAEGADMIACDACDRWFHWLCVGLTQAPPSDENWYCQECRFAKAKQGGAGVQKRKYKTHVIKKKHN